MGVFQGFGFGVVLTPPIPQPPLIGVADNPAYKHCFAPANQIFKNLANETPPPQLDT
jgi:hypothetical protein